MGERAVQFYQGSDWLTYRWSVAQLFDTLDRIRDVCNHSSIKVTTSSMGAAGSTMPRYEVTEDDAISDMLGYIIELCDDLSGELDAVLADIIPSIQNPTPQRWMGFEMQFHLQTLRQQALCEHHSLEPSPAVVDAIIVVSTRLRDLLKKIDL